jgi:RNA polymerase sigma factor (sigma-70 family)
MGQNADVVGGEERSGGLTPEEFVDLFNRYSADLYVFARSLVRERQDALDAVGQSFLAAWEATMMLTPPFVHGGDDQHRRHWLFQAANWKARNILRQRRPGRAYPGDADTHDNPPRPLRRVPPMPFEDQIAEREVLQTALASMKPEAAASAVLAVLKFNRAEIADILRLRPSQVKRILPPAMEQLRTAYHSADSNQEVRRTNEGKKRSGDLE